MNGRWDKRYSNEVVKVGNFLNYDWTVRKQTVDKQRGDYALTEFKLREYAGGKYALLDAFPKTGRTHQIRIHLAHILYPILGDDKYEGDPYDRLMLHSHKVTLTSHDGNVIEAESAIPEEFEKVLAK